MLVLADPAQFVILQLAIASRNSATNSLKSEDISLSSSDRDYLEVSFSGIWITSNLKSEIAEGVFVADLGTYLEAHIYRVWLENQLQLTSV